MVGENIDIAYIALLCFVCNTVTRSH